MVCTFLLINNLLYYFNTIENILLPKQLSLFDVACMSQLVGSSHPVSTQELRVKGTSDSYTSNHEITAKSDTYGEPAQNEVTGNVNHKVDLQNPQTSANIRCN